jgi:peptidoglycan/xylan/chitin deacetylase (PgdA/CDA1 family)
MPARIPILVYHSVSDKPIGVEELSVTNKAFEEQIKYLHDNGYTAITFDELSRAGEHGKPVLITFDDGYEDNYTNVYPILKKYGTKATVFLIADRIGGTGHLTSEEILRMRDLVSFQSHTLSHPKLSDVGDKRLIKELADAKTLIGSITKAPVFVLAYPCGAYSDRVLQTASGLYEYAVTTEYGYYKKDAPRLRLRRIGVLRSLTLNGFIGAVRSQGG